MNGPGGRGIKNDGTRSGRDKSNRLRAALGGDSQDVNGVGVAARQNSYSVTMAAILLATTTDTSNDLGGSRGAQDVSSTEQDSHSITMAAILPTATANANVMASMATITSVMAAPSIPTTDSSSSSSSISFTPTTHAATPISTTTSSTTKTYSDDALIIGGTICGAISFFTILLLLFWCVIRRSYYNTTKVVIAKESKLHKNMDITIGPEPQASRGSTPTTYMDLDREFAGVPFGRAEAETQTQTQTRDSELKLVPQPLFWSRADPSLARISEGDVSPTNSRVGTGDGGDEGEAFKQNNRYPSTYSESQYDNNSIRALSQIQGHPYPYSFPFPDSNPYHQHHHPSSPVSSPQVDYYPPYYSPYTSQIYSTSTSTSTYTTFAYANYMSTQRTIPIPAQLEFELQPQPRPDHDNNTDTTNTNTNYNHNHHNHQPREPETGNPSSPAISEVHNNDNPPSPPPPPPPPPPLITSNQELRAATDSLERIVRGPRGLLGGDGGGGERSTRRIRSPSSNSDGDLREVPLGFGGG